MDPLSNLIGLSVIVFGAVLLSFTGVAVGAAARYGLPKSVRGPGGWLLTAIAVGVVAVLVSLATTATEPMDRSRLAGFALMIAAWTPGFIAASLGANRLVLLATLPIAVVLVSFLSQTFGVGLAPSI